MPRIKYVVLVTATALCASGGWATTRNWTNEVGGSFSDDANWDTVAPGLSDGANFNLDNATAYTVTGVPDATTNQQVQVQQDKVKLMLSGVYTLTNGNALVVSTDGTTGTLEVVGGTLSVNRSNKILVGSSGGVGTQHGTLVVDGGIFGAQSDYYVAEEFSIGRAGTGDGTGDVIIRGGARLTTPNGINWLAMNDGANSLVIDNSEVNAFRLVVGNNSSTANNTIVVTNSGKFQVSAFLAQIGRCGKARLTITGNGSEFNFKGGNNNNMDVGAKNGGKGLIEVLNGADVRDGYGAIGALTHYGNAGTTRGSLLVDGVGSTYKVEKEGAAEYYVYFATNGSTCVVRNGGRIYRDNGSKLIFQAGSFLGGDGTLDLPVDMSGTLKPGGEMDNAGWYDVTSGAGVMTISNLTLGATGVCDMELGGKAAGAYDQVTVGGDLVLAGNINVSLINGFTYGDAAATAYTVLETTAGTLSGSFANVANGEWIDTGDPNEAFQVHYGPASMHDPNAVVLTPRPLGTVISFR